jgi:pre-mRNA-processing factor 39
MRKEVLDSLAKEKEKRRRKKREDKDDSDKDEESQNPEEEEVPGDDEPEHFAVSAEEENQAMRENIIKEHKKFFKDTEEKVQARWKYEDSIKRPYFHMKPLERGQLRNWSDYLAHEIKRSHRDKEKGNEGNDTGIEILFERCLIACALYEEFWIV